jgi:hypothetical protein
MGKLYDEITPELAVWVKKQPMFFVATAPLARGGHVNCSPKGLDTLRLLDAHTAAYVDLTGSGSETIAHVRENGRIVLMFCAFDGPPKIVRFHGKAAVVAPAAPQWQELIAQFPHYPSARAIIHINVTRVSDSCGYGVPKLAYVEERDALPRWVSTKGEANLPAYRREKNARSIDGLPGADFD